MDEAYCIMVHAIKFLTHVVTVQRPWLAWTTQLVICILALTMCS